MQTWICIIFGNSLSVDVSLEPATGVRDGRSDWKPILTHPMPADSLQAVLTGVLMFKIKHARWRDEASSTDSTCHEKSLPSLTSENISLISKSGDNPT